MNRITRGLFAVTLVGAISIAPIPFTADQPMATTVYAHGHHNSGSHHGGSHHGGYNTGTNYYYCNGHDAHLHNNGVCPYATTSSSVSKSTIKKVQKRLNHLGYHCGTANGVLASKTKKALKKFQREHSLKVSGTIKKSTLNALGL